MLITVFHHNALAAQSSAFSIAAAATFPAFYTAVAVLDITADDVLEAAFERTQNLDEPWSQYGHRSSATGDVFQLEDGRTFVVAGVGFVEVIPVPAAPYVGLAEVTRERLQADLPSFFGPVEAQVADDVAAAALVALGYSKLAGIKAFRLLGRPFAEARALVEAAQAAAEAAR